MICQISLCISNQWQATRTLLVFINSKKGAEAQQVGGSRTLLLDLLERERPGVGNCLGIVEHEATMPRQQDD